MPATLTITLLAPGLTALLPTLALTPSIVTFVFGFVDAIVMTRAIAVTLRVGFGVGESVGFGVNDVVGFGVADPEAVG